MNISPINPYSQPLSYSASFTSDVCQVSPIEESKTSTLEVEMETALSELDFDKIYDLIEKGCDPNIEILCTSKLLGNARVLISHGGKRDVAESEFSEMKTGSSWDTFFIDALPYVTSYPEDTIALLEEHIKFLENDFKEYSHCFDPEYVDLYLSSLRERLYRMKWGKNRLAYLEYKIFVCRTLYTLYWWEGTHQNSWNQDCWEIKEKFLKDQDIELGEVYYLDIQDGGFAVFNDFEGKKVSLLVYISLLLDYIKSFMVPEIEQVKKIQNKTELKEFYSDMFHRDVITHFLMAEKILKIHELLIQKGAKELDHSSEHLETYLKV